MDEVGRSARSRAQRGPGRAEGAGYPFALPRCAAMAVGSVPHLDPEEAVELILRYTPEIPAWPQLPRRSFRENMYAQFAEGLPGLVLDEEDERVYVRDEPDDEAFLAFAERFYSPGSDQARGPTYPIEEDVAAALPRMLDVLPTLDPPFVKGQVTGPISFGLTVPFESRRALFFDDTYRDAIARLIAAKARWQEERLASAAPGALPLVMYDEPYLTQLGSGYLSLPEDTFAVLTETLEAVSCLRGIHVCGGTDWSRVAELPLDALNFDAADHLDAIAANVDAVAEFVQQGGLLVWGAVPNDERASRATAEDLGRSVLGGVDLLGRAGADEDAVLAASFVSPACGTGSLSESLAETCFRRTAETSAWLRARL